MEMNTSGLSRLVDYCVLVVYCGVIRWMDQLVVVLRDREGIMRLGVLYYISILLC